MRRIIVLLMVAAVVAVTILLAAGGPAMAQTLPGATCNFGTHHAHEEAVREGLPAHAHIPCEPD